MDSLVTHPQRDAHIGAARRPRGGEDVMGRGAIGARPPPLDLDAVLRPARGGEPAADLIEFRWRLVLAVCLALAAAVAFVSWCELSDHARC